MNKVSAEFQKLLTLLLAEQPEKAEAAVWLQGDRFDRGEKVLTLLKENFAPRVILTGNNVLVGKSARPEEENVTLTEMAEWLQARGIASGRIMIDNQAMNTREQAENVLALAQKNDWRTIILVASPYHQVRAFLTFLKRAREISWVVRFINQPAELSLNVLPSGRTKSAAEYLLEEECKIRDYADEVATVREGLAELLAERI